ncbi:hypothetical protein BB560_004423 [Smittium megazygosporum]|uniref:Endonuclease/exonuclease/phosphatase domain-containing protein n=1 Tax=Smittium megazygosporum TaxID=133381 RepID=A0A2T9Z988_9FUNG|nr:hypothetical protein BB560_004423 [Smittium megazygosporum]
MKTQKSLSYLEAVEKSPAQELVKKIDLSKNQPGLNLGTAEKEVLKISINLFRGIPMNILIEAIISPLCSLGKILEITVLELKSGIPLSNNTKIMMETKDREQIPVFIEFEGAKIVFDYENMPTICRFSKRDITEDLNYFNQKKEELHDEKGFLYVFKSGEHTFKLNTKHTQQILELNTRQYNITETKHQTGTVSPINPKTIKENFDLQKINHNTGVNPETELKVLNEVQNHKGTISLSCETDPNKINVRIVVASIKVENLTKNIEIINFYAPAVKEDGRTFYQELYISFEIASNTILLGDFNNTKSNITDRHPLKKTSSECFLLEEVMQKLELNNTYDRQNQKQMLTWHLHAGKIKPRIDHILAYDNLTDKFSNMTTTVGNTSDHLQIFVFFCF